MQFLIQVKVCETKKKIPKLEIVLIDYGIGTDVSLNKLYPLQEQFCQEPAIGLLCSLHQLEPFNDAWEGKKLEEDFPSW